MAQRVHRQGAGPTPEQSEIMQLNATDTMNEPTPKRNPEGTAAQRKAVRILAKSLFRELTSQGYDERQIVSLATELISEVTAKMSAQPPANG
jgi:hypothetical protein